MQSHFRYPKVWLVPPFWDTLPHRPSRCSLVRIVFKPMLAFLSYFLPAATCFSIWNKNPRVGSSTAAKSGCWRHTAAWGECRRRRGWQIFIFSPLPLVWLSLFWTVSWIIVWHTTFVRHDWTKFLQSIMFANGTVLNQQIWRIFLCDKNLILQNIRKHNIESSKTLCWQYLLCICLYKSITTYRYHYL